MRARLLVHLVLRNVLDGSVHKPEILVDLLDSDNMALFEDYDTEVLITPLIASHVLAQVALRRELNVVYEELFAAGGAEIFFRRVSDYGNSRSKCEFWRTPRNVGMSGRNRAGYSSKRRGCAQSDA